MAAVEFADDGGKEIGRDRRDDAEAQPPDEMVARGAGEVGEFIDRAQDAARPLRQVLAERRQPHLPRRTLDQRDAQRLLEFAHLHGERRLRNGTGLGRPAEMAEPRQRLEIAQLFQRQVRHQAVLSSRSDIST